MDNMIAKLRDFLKDEDGLTTVEYAVGGSLISAAVIAAFTLLGENVRDVINYIANQIATPAP